MLAAEHRLHDRVIACAAADIARQQLSKLLARPAHSVAQERGGRNHEAWSAEAALHGTLGDQLALERRRSAVWP